ncbi:MAG: sulfotransferase [Chloroflexota bacterium]
MSVENTTVQPQHITRYQLPDFIIGGALKSGTTSLYYYLRQHPDIYMPSLKEPRYFAFDETNPEHVGNAGFFSIRTLEDYAHLFDDAMPTQVRGEASPHYMLSELAPERIARTIPDVKLIFSLRNPVQRAYSGYWHEYRLGHETRTVEEALTGDDYLVTTGCYAARLAPWYDTFDASRIKLVLFDDIKADPVGVVSDLCRFLEVSPDFEFDTAVRNQGGAMRNVRLGRVLEKLKTHPLRSKLNPLLPEVVRTSLVDVRSRNFEAPPPMSAEVAAYLNDYYADDILKLEEITGRDLSAWRVA